MIDPALDLPRPTLGEEPPSASPPRRRPPWQVAVLVGALVCGFLLLRLFAGGVVGMGDQGDGRRLMCAVGVADTRAGDASGAAYLHPLWSAHRWYGETCEGEPDHSTELWLLWPAKYLSAFAYGDDGELDLRALGVLCSVLAGLLCGGLVLALRGPLWVRGLVAGGIGAAFADSTFAGYFVSPYGDPAALLGTVGTVLALVLIWRRGHTTVPTLLFVAGGALFAIGAKAPMAGILLPVTVGVLTVPYGGFLPLGRASDVSWGRGRRLRWYGRRWPALALLALTFALTLVHVAGRPATLRDQDRYAMVFAQILPHSTERLADLQALGGDAMWIRASGVALGAPGSLAGTPEYRRFLDRVTWFRVAVFFGSHPSRLARAFYQGVAATAALRPKYVGSYPAAPGRRPFAQEDRVPVFSWLFAVFRWANWLLVVEWVLLALAGLLVIRHELLPRWTRVYGHLALWLSAAIPACLWTEMLTEGAADTTRHMVCVAFLSVAGLPVLAACSVFLHLSLRSHGGVVVGHLPPGGPAG